MSAIGNANGTPWLWRILQALVPWFYDDLNFLFNKRVDNVLYDEISGGVGTAEIVGGYEASFDGASRIATDISIVDGDTLEFSVFDITPFGVRGSYFGRLELLPTRVSRIGVNELVENNMIVFVKKLDDSGYLNSSLVFTTSLKNNIENYKVSIIGTEMFISRLRTGEIKSYDFGEPIIFDVEYTGSYGTSFHFGNISNITKNGQLIYALNNHSINSVSNVKATWTGTEAYQLNNQTNLPLIQAALDQDYIQENATGIQVIAPQYPTPIGWTEHKGGKLHNLIDSYIDFSNSSAATKAAMDKSDPLRWLQAVRDSVNFDSGNVYKWYIDELMYDYMHDNSTPAYQNTLFTGIQKNYGNKLNIFQIFGYQTQKEDSDLIKVLKYINNLTTYKLADGSDLETTDGVYKIKY